jgi:hypothetical protein
MPIGPKPHKKMVEKLPPVRLTPDERQAIQWLTSRLSNKAGVSYNMSDTVRAALALLLQTEAKAAEAAGEEVPEVVRRTL